ncbi:DUF885 domain-containing protein [Novosphingobium sp.]|uniref:DUF885 domain-containing protein n=1 Tax=Novosphingobium sp. TaxID=1874826 RepID=UPI003D0D2E7B
MNRIRSRLSAGILMLLVTAASPALAAAPVAGSTATQASEDARLTAFLDSEFATELTMRPQLATRLGLKQGQDQLDDISDAAMLHRLEWRRGSVARMKATFDPARLSPTGSANYAIWALELDRAELSYRFRRYQPPFYAFIYSLHNELPNFLINTHRVGDERDMVAYIARVRAIPAVLDTGIEQSRMSAAQGINAPRFEDERVVAGSRRMITGAPFDTGADSPLWSDARAKIAALVAAHTIDDATATRLTGEARDAILALAPAYGRVMTWAGQQLPGAPSGVVGAGSLPGGAQWYAAALRLNTNTDLDAATIHQTGLAEVARIENVENTLARKAGFADEAAMHAHMAVADRPVPWTDALRTARLARANAIVADNRAKLSAWFRALPAYATEVVREPAFSEVAGGAAHASFASSDGKRPGRVFLHMLGDTDSEDALPDLMCHEAIPGHLLQGDIQVRQTGTPLFRKGYGYVAFNEGWGLYAEELCREMGVYTTPAQELARLDGELFRAARLVVDTGIHAQGWSQDRAVAYLIATGHQTDAMAQSETRRYITLPGQATGYKIGMMRIMALRKKASDALGPRFDIRGFDDLLVGSGSIPLAVLDQQVDAWIAAQR